jgi:hypothetical protein
MYVRIKHVSGLYCPTTERCVLQSGNKMSDINQEQRSKSTFVRHVIAFYPWKCSYNLIFFYFRPPHEYRQRSSSESGIATTYLHSRKQCCNPQRVGALDGKLNFRKCITSFSCIEINGFNKLQIQL